MSNRYSFFDETVSTYRSPDFVLDYPLSGSYKVRDTYKLVLVPRHVDDPSLSSSELAEVKANRINLVDTVGLLADIGREVLRVDSSDFTGADAAAKAAQRSQASLCAQSLLLGLANALLSDSDALDSLGDAFEETVVSDVVSLISSNSSWTDPSV